MLFAKLKIRRKKKEKKKLETRGLCVTKKKQEGITFL